MRELVNLMKQQTEEILGLLFTFLTANGPRACVFTVCGAVVVAEGERRHVEKAPYSFRSTNEWSLIFMVIFIHRATFFLSPIHFHVPLLVSPCLPWGLTQIQRLRKRILHEYIFPLLKSSQYSRSVCNLIALGNLEVGTYFRMAKC